MTTRTPSPTVAARQPAADLPPDSRGGRGQAIAGLAVALVIVAAAWWIGGRAGWETIGQGGINQQLLPRVGDPAPDFQTADVFGNPIRLSDYAGQPIWLMFWGSWCPPCRAEFPDIQAAYRQVRPEGVQLLGVSLDESPLEAAAYAGRNGAEFLVLSDPDRSDTRAAYPIFNFPTHIFIGADGIVRSVVLEDMGEAQALGEAEKIVETSR